MRQPGASAATNSLMNGKSSMRMTQGTTATMAANKEKLEKQDLNFYTSLLSHVLQFKTKEIKY